MSSSILLCMLILSASTTSVRASPPREEEGGRCQETVSELETRVEELTDANDDLRDDVTALTISDRRKSDELAAIKEAITNVLLIKNRIRCSTLKVPAGIRWMGVIDVTEWHDAYVHVVDKDDPRHGYDASKSLAENEAVALQTFHLLMKDPEWHPFRVVAAPGGEARYEIVRDNPRLARIRQDWGARVCDLVVRAMEELEEYNPSGRYRTPLPWDFRNDEAVEYAEVINQIKTIILRTDTSYFELLRVVSQIYGLEN